MQQKMVTVVDGTWFGTTSRNLLRSTINHPTNAGPRRSEGVRIRSEIIAPELPETASQIQGSAGQTNNCTDCHVKQRQLS